MVDNLCATISELENEQVYSYYGSLGIIIKAVRNSNDQKTLLSETMLLSQSKWQEIMTKGKSMF